MISLYKDILYGENFLDFLVFFSYCKDLLKSFYSLSIGNLLWVFFFFFDNTHSLSFHFYLYNVKEENALHFENFEKSFFVFYLLQFCCTIPNACRSLSSMVVHSNMEPKYI